MVKPDSAKIASKSKDMQRMDDAAVDAENDLENVPEEAIVAMAQWWEKWYADAGHRRLGRVLLAQLPPKKQKEVVLPKTGMGFPFCWGQTPNTDEAGE